MAASAASRPRPSEGTRPLVRMSGVVRRFGRVTALDGAELELRAGEVHGVLGENGAGKTTLLHVLGGMIEPDDGTIEISARPVRLRSPRDAWRHGIGLVHQHFKLVGALTVLENLALGHRDSGAGAWGRVPYGSLRRSVEELEARTGLAVPLDARVAGLGVGALQRIEILKALLREPRVLVLDEPTAVLTPDEVAALFRLLRSLAAEGRAVVVVAHKLDEVLAVADRVTVLRAGRTVTSGPRDGFDEPALVRAMVGDGKGPPEPGEERRAGKERRAGGSGPVVAELAGVTTGRLRDVSLSVRRGEIVGVAGVEGNGQRDLARVLAGRLEPTGGRAGLPPGTGFVPEDRTREGLIGSFDLTENVALGLHRLPEAGGTVLRWRFLRAGAERVRERFRVRAPSLRSRVSTLSGGNQQRVVVGRELELATDLLVAENPTRGLDFQATAFVRGCLARLASRGPEGPGTVLVSSDLDEVLELSDRVFVMVRGTLRSVPPHRRSREGVGAAMLGGTG